MRVEDARIGQKVRTELGRIGTVKTITRFELIIELPDGMDYGAVFNCVTPIDDPCNSCSTLIARAGEIGEKDAEITKLKCDLDFANARIKLLQSRVCETNRHVESLMGIRFDSKEAAEENAKLRSKNRAQNNALYAWEEASRKQRDEITFLKAERDRLAETVRFQDEKIREISEARYVDPSGQKLSEDLHRDARIIREFLDANCDPAVLEEIADRIGWKVPRICYALAYLRDVGIVKLEDGEYSLVVK
jgi:hypothetical protein